MGADFYSKKVFYEKQLFHVQYWDTSGEINKRNYGSAFYRNPDCCVLVYDATNQEVSQRIMNTLQSFENVEQWRDEFAELAMIGDPDNFYYVVAGNKSDLEDDLEVDSESLEHLCDKFGENCDGFAVSAKTGKNVSQMFDCVLELGWKKLQDEME